MRTDRPYARASMSAKVFPRVSLASKAAVALMAQVANMYTAIGVVEPV